MFVKPCAPSLYLQKLNALSLRVSDNNPKKTLVNKESYKQNAGYQGEKSLSYYLSFLDENKYFIFHDLRLSNGNNFFQIDFLILTSRYCLIIDAKNITGELEFDSNNNQLIKTVNEKVEVLGDPFAQVRHQRNQLIDFFNKNNLPPLHIQYLVALSNKNALIKKVTGRNGEYRKLSRGSNVLEKIQDFEGKLYTDCLTEKEIKKLIKFLLKSHTPFAPDILKQFNIQKSELLTGVHCPQCSYLAMQHTFGKWVCPNCKFQSRDAHKQTIHDYFLIIGPFLTNREFRWFTQLSQSQVATNLLSSMDLITNGDNKGRVYFPRI